MNKHPTTAEPLTIENSVPVKRKQLNCSIEDENSEKPLLTKYNAKARIKVCLSHVTKNWPRKSAV
jgi:hypothetical protein